LLPVALRVDQPVCQEELARLGRALFVGASSATEEEAAEAFVREIAALCDRVGTPRRLSQVGVTRDQIPAIARDSRGSSMSGNPRELSDAELTAILDEIY
jgi:alcohol dehydrogenase class IV